MIMNFPQQESTLLREILSFLHPSKKHQVWLVGGTIRDLLEDENNFYDLDLVTSFNPIPACKAFANATKSGLVILDNDRKIVRVVYKSKNGKEYTFDVSYFKGKDIDEDLSLRDFTINAIASPLFDEGLFLLQNNCLKLYDPLEGMEHLLERKLVPCSETSLADDPLRIMRAFRFKAVFDLSLNPELIQEIKEKKELLLDISGERIRDEFYKVLDTDVAYRQIKTMEETGVLDCIFPELRKCRKVEQNDWHHLDVFDHSLLTLRKFETLIQIPSPHPWWEKFDAYLNSEISPHRSYKASYKLACLFHDIGKVTCKSFDKEKQRFTFHGHEMEGVRLFKNIGERLKLSSTEIAFHGKVIKNHMRPGVMVQQGITPKTLFRFYNECEIDGTGICLLSLADRLAALGQLEVEEIIQFTAKIYEIMDEYFYHESLPKIKPFINGKDLIGFGATPGPIFKQVLETIKEGQFLGEIKTFEEAQALALSILKENDAI
jgi:poly(A) polymerase